MKKPQILSIQRALDAIDKPIARFGDLIAVQVHPQLKTMNPRDFPNGEMRSIFVPDRDLTVTHFRREETETFLRELYAAGGWIESIADYDDEALALHYNYTAGINAGGFAGNAGDARCFELDCIEAVGNLPPNASRELVSAVVNTVRLMHRRYKLVANVGARHKKQQNEKSKRERPVKNDAGQSLVDVIAGLAREHSASRAAEIWPHLKVAIEDWSGDTVTESGTGDNRRYSFMKLDGTRDTVTFGPFRKKLALLRKR